ncbi:copper-exporting P-type ATPase CopA [Mergibacter septicus]|uniref:hypothetical protein n=1 Tax=Mergibacter septicus TaxID=221402 RepID=UPI00223E96C2|nr:hypothetical protein [Mergibacter septicus]
MALFFKLSGLSCQHCVNQVEQALTSLVDPEQFKLSTQFGGESGYFGTKYNGSY